MNDRRSPLLALPLTVLCIACSASPNINVGNEADGSIAGSGGTSGFGGVGGIAGGDDTLTALITEPPSEMAIEVITISCAGECKQVLAIASGGNDPYTFAWNDGVTTAAREICADQDASFTVTVNDTPMLDGEFPYAGQSTTASVTANVLTCPSDGGTPSWDACLEDPSFERGLGGPWQACTSFFGAGIRFVTQTSETGWPGTQFTPATDGQQFVVINASASDLVTSGGLGQPLCNGAIPSTLAGAPISIAFDAALLRSPNAISNPADFKLELYGGEACAAVQAAPHPNLLWTAPTLSTTWTRQCATLDPQAAGSGLTFYAIASPAAAGDTLLLLDNVSFVDACP